jgi:hypothetical protein
MVLYIQRKEGERELDSAETERESVCVRGRALHKEGVVSVQTSKVN